jgi:hypothetical protein
MEIDELDANLIVVLCSYVGRGGTWGNPLAYSIDRNWAIRGTTCTYDVGEMPSTR